MSFEDAEAERMDADNWTKSTRADVSDGPVDVAADNGFAALGLPERIVERLAREGITSPFPIQTATIPDALAGARRPRPWPDRLRQDARVRPAAHHATARGPRPRAGRASRTP